jgi:predicted transcriptional regulator
MLTSRGYMKESLFSVSEYMNGVLMHADKSESVINIARLMHRNNADAVMIRSNGVPVGIVTSKEILSGLLSSISSQNALSGEHIMRSPLVTISHSDDINSAWELMRERDLEQLPVNKEGDIIGLIVQRDLIKDLSWYGK